MYLRMSRDFFPSSTNNPHKLSSKSPQEHITLSRSLSRSDDSSIVAGSIGALDSESPIPVKANIAIFFYQEIRRVSLFFVLTDQTMWHVRSDGQPKSFLKATMMS